MSPSASASFDRFGGLFGLLGLRRQCPVCGEGTARFTPLPGEFEQAARRHGYEHFGRSETFNVREYSCPSCGASDRERLYALFINLALAGGNARQRTRLLHFAPEVALSARLRARTDLDYYTADASMAGVDHRVDLCALPYADAAFDAFICSHVLEHVADDRAALRELRRILRPGGWGILMVPLMTHLDASLESSAAMTEADRYRLFGQGDHLRLYAKRDFLVRLAEAKMTARQLGVRDFGVAAFRRSGITRQSMLYVVTHD